MHEVKVPEVGESITEGLLVQWLAEDGGAVEADDPLFELETDKITMEVPSPVAGRVTVEVAAGQTVQVGQRVGTIDTDAKEKKQGDGDRAEADTQAAAEPSDSAAEAQASTDTGERPPRAGEERKPPREEATSQTAPPPSPDPPPQPSPQAPRGVPGFGPSAPASAAQRGGERRLDAPAGREQMRVKAGRRHTDTRDLSPAVRRLVLEHQLEAGKIPPSGPGGRLTKADVLQYLEEAERATTASVPAAAVPEVEAKPAAPAAEEEAAAEPAAEPTADSPRQTRAKMSPLRARIAERLVQAQQTAAMLTTFNEADMSEIMALRKRYRDEFEQAHGHRLGFMSFFVKAVVDALQAVPSVNAFIDGDEIVTNHFYDIGVAVGTDKGLVVPVVRDCDRMGFAEIEQAITDLAQRVRDKKIGLEDLQGGCFTISNGGIYGSLLSTPILNPPQSGILGMHSIKKRPVVVDDEIVIRPMMYLALSYDHRLVDGKDAVTFLRRVVECLEHPERMMLHV